MNKTWKIWAVFTGVFLAGVLAGGLVTWRVGRLLMQQRMAKAEQHFVGQQLRRLRHDLDLTPEQAEQVRKILDRTGDELRVQRQQTFKDAKTILDRMHAEIALLLTPEQRQRMTELNQRQRERMQRFFMAPPGSHDGPPPGPPPPGGRPELGEDPPHGGG